MADGTDAIVGIRQDDSPDRNIDNALIVTTAGAVYRQRVQDPEQIALLESVLSALQSSDATPQTSVDVLQSILAELQGTLDVSGTLSVSNFPTDFPDAAGETALNSLISILQSSGATPETAYEVLDGIRTALQGTLAVTVGNFPSDFPDSSAQGFLSQILNAIADTSATPATVVDVLQAILAELQGGAADNVTVTNFPSDYPDASAQNLLQNLVEILNSDEATPRSTAQLLLEVISQLNSIDNTAQTKLDSVIALLQSDEATSQSAGNLLKQILDELVGPDNVIVDNFPTDYPDAAAESLLEAICDKLQSNEATPRDAVDVLVEVETLLENIFTRLGDNSQTTQIVDANGLPALSQILSTDNTQTITSSEASPGSPWIGAWESTRVEGIVRTLTVLASADSTISGTFTFEFTDSTDPNTDHPTLGTSEISESQTIGDFEEVRDFDLVNAGRYFRVAFEPANALGGSSVIVTTTLSRQFSGPFVRLANQEIEEANAAMGGQFAYLKGFNERTGKSVNIRPTSFGELKIVDESVSQTQTGSQFVEGILDHVSLIFSRDRQDEAITHLVDVDAGATPTGTVAADATQGQVVFATAATPGSLCYFESDKTLRYDQAAHMIRFEQTIEPLLTNLTGDAVIDWGAGEDDGAGGILNGIHWRIRLNDDTTPVPALYACRTKNGVLVSEVEQVDFNRDKLDGNTPSKFLFNQEPQAINLSRNNYYIGQYEWLGVAPPEYGVQTPTGRVIDVHVEEFPNQNTGTTLQEPNIPLFVRISNDTSAGGVIEVRSGSWRGGTHSNKSVIVGRDGDDNLEEVGVAPVGGGQFATLTRDVGLDSNRTVFGSLNTETPIVDVAIDFSSDVLNLISDTTANGATATTSVGQSVISTGTNAAGAVTRRTRVQARYRPGSEMRFDFTGVFTQGVVDSQQFIGAMSPDDQDGFFIGYETDATFVVCRRQDGVDYPVSQSSWNGDALDGSSGSAFTFNGGPVAWDPTKGNIYRIRFGWLGYSVILFEVQSPDGEYVRMHTIHYPNSYTEPSLYQTSLDVWSYAANSGNTTNLTMNSASWRGGTLGPPRPQARVIFQKTSAADGTLLSGGAPTIDPVLNTDTNVFDSGWIRTLDYPGGNFINIFGDTSLSVYLMNASDDQGSNMVGDSAPAIQTTAGIPAPFAAPFFDDFYRILIVNESGVSLTDYTIHNTAHEASQQGLSLGMEQTLLSFFSASLTRSVLAAVNDSGQYGNITRSLGAIPGLRVSVSDHEAETPIEALGTFTTNQSNVGTSAVQIVGSPLTDRKSVMIKALAANNAKVYIGPTSGVTISNGMELNDTEFVIIDLSDAGSQIWAIASGGTQRVAWLQVGD